MGLDMYLRGEKFLWTDWQNKSNNLTEDGFRVARKELELGYWRKHPNLHGYIVKTFAEGVDECQQIDLEIEALEKLLAAVKADELPETQGFFFGKSSPDDKPETIEIIEKAIAWLKTEEPGVSRSIFYQASW